MTATRRRRGPWLVGGLVMVVVMVGAVAWFIRTVPGECPAVGCQSSVRFDLASLDPADRERSATAEVCVDGSCTFQVIVGNQPHLYVPHGDRTVRSATITIEDQEGAVVQRLELTHEVEGTETRTFDGCVPVCWAVVLVERDGALDAR